MGSADGSDDEGPIREVRITKPFYVGVYEVTNAQWKVVMGEVPNNSQNDQRPVEQVSWDDAVAFCRKLSELSAETRAGRVYRLPTEAEWEYACRAGSTTAYSFGDNAKGLCEHGWFAGQTHAVGRKMSNAWGLFDMHGNVWEWCSDWYRLYLADETTDPSGPAEGSFRVYRGGSWNCSVEECRSAYRGWSVPENRYDDVGFRVAVSASGAKSPEAEE